MSQPAMWRERNAPLTAWSLAALCVAFAATGSILAAALGGNIPVKQLVVAVIWLPGALVAAGRPRIAVGWLLGVALMFGGSALAQEWVAYATAREIEAGLDWAIWFVDRFSAFLVVLTLMALILLPNGRLPSRRWGAVVWPVVGLQCLALAVWSAAQGPAAAPDSDFPAALASIPNPVGVLPAGWAAVVQGTESLILSAPLLLCPVAFGVRLLRSRGDDRSGLAALLLAAGAFVLRWFWGTPCGPREPAHWTSPPASFWQPH